jgi:phosphonate transport system substrate-binding protein
MAAPLTPAGRRLAAPLLLGAALTLLSATAPEPGAAQGNGQRFPFLRELQDIPLPAPSLLPDFLAEDGDENSLPSGAEAPEGSGVTTEDAPAAPRPTESAGPASGTPGRSGADTEGVTEPVGPMPAESGPPPAMDTAAAPPADQGASAGGTAAGQGETVSSYSLRAFRIGVLAGRDVWATMTGLEPVAEGLRGALGRSVDILPMPTYRAMIDAQETQRIDAGFYSAEAFAMAEEQCRCLEPLVAPLASDGTAAYFAIIVAASESGIRTVADLAGKEIAVAAADSVGGRRMQETSLASEGFDLSAASLVETASSHDAVRLVADGKADAAFAWSSLHGDQAAGYSRGTLADLVASGDIGMDEVAVVWRSPAIAHGPLAVAKALPDEDKRRIEAYLLGLSETLPTAFDLLNPFYPGGYVAVEREDYRGVETLARTDAVRSFPPASTGAPSSGPD